MWRKQATPFRRNNLNRTALFASILVTLFVCSPATSQTTSTTGDCSPIVTDVNNLTIVCGTSGSEAIPIFSGKISTGSHDHENFELLSFVQQNMFNVVFLNLLIDIRDHIPFDHLARDLTGCEYGHWTYELNRLFDVDGLMLPVVTETSYEKYLSFPDDADAWGGMSFDEQRHEYDRHMGDIEMCLQTAISLQTRRARKWDDNGWAVSGFFLVSDTGGHMTRPLITIEERDGTTSEWQAASSLIEKADEARWARYIQWESRIND